MINRRLMIVPPALLSRGHPELLVREQSILVPAT